MLENKLEKIVVNVGVGRLSTQVGFDDKILPEITKELSTITGQRPSQRKATKSIAGFKLRQGTTVGLKTTLRSKKMDGFFKKFFNIVLPRVRDFRGIDSNSVDKNGNLSIGLKDYLVFPEVSAEIAKINFGLEITLVPAIKKRESAMALYKKLGVPFKK
ncbi:MAG: 50S ribosomal protein L5 [Candidatus Pacebacteria bacterium]|nr:50S ribosomal protein L5 [Candidatus Paceibacterota bacterium]